MLELLSPFYFYIAGAVGVLIPLVLHLIQSKRTITIPFPTIRFLQLAQKKASQKIRMENLLLWLIRTLLLVMLALAFAMPMLRNRTVGKWVGRSARDVGIVIDGSYSMAYNLGRTTVWEKAIETAVTLLEGLSEQDRFCIFVARDHVEPLIQQLSGDREEAISRLKALEFSHTSSRLAPAVMEANTALNESKQRREREIHILTDTQALPWEGLGEAVTSSLEAGATEAAKSGDAAKPAESSVAEAAAMSSWDPSKIDDRTAFFVTMMGASDPENVATLDIDLETGILMADTPSRVIVHLGVTGPPHGTAATLYVDDEEVATQSLPAASDDPGDFSFIVPPLERGRHAARIELPDDNLVLDNTFYFVLKAEDQFPTLCIGGPDDTFFLRAALGANLGGRAAINATWYQPNEIEVDQLKNYACIFACNAVPLAAAEVSALEKFIDAGGLLALFPGDRGAASDYGVLNFLPGTPLAVQAIPMVDRKSPLIWDAPHHVLFQNLGDGGSATVSIRQQLLWDTFPAGTERLVSHGDGAPFLVGTPHGRGYVLAFSITADRSWSDFPLSPFFLPIVHQIVQFAANVGSYSPYVWCTSSLPLEPYLPEATPDHVLLDPEGATVPIRSAVVDGQMILNVEGITRAGLYEMRDPDGGAPAPALAANMTRDESDLSPLDPATLRERLGVEEVHIATDLESLERQIEESRVGRTFGEQLLWFALFLAGLEFFYANFLMKKTPGLSDTLGVELSGNVPMKGHE